jgi:predicted RNA-binding Zn-ribbon protein involved in translation (DUF1610 family)
MTEDSNGDDISKYSECPECGHEFDDELDDASTTVSLDLGGSLMEIRFSCPDCDSPLRLGVESGSTESLDLDISLELDG